MKRCDKVTFELTHAMGAAAEAIFGSAESAWALWAHVAEAGK